jgi:uncharacterized membrane protein YkvA (DUF1232 family)
MLDFFHSLLVGLVVEYFIYPLDHLPDLLDITVNIDELVFKLPYLRYYLLI